MILFIITQNEPPPWLQYIIQEFQRFNQAEFEIQLKPKSAFNGDSPAIYYTSQFYKAINIPDCSSVLPNSQTQFISNDLFISQGTQVSDSRFECQYDIFWNAFIYLSRLEEYRYQMNGNSISSYSFKHPRIDKTTFDFPIVNILFKQFESIINKYFPQLQFHHSREINIEFSHDVDYLEKTPQIIFKKTAFNMFNTLRALFKPSQFLPNLKKTVVFPFTRPSYSRFELLQDLEKKSNIRSIFYVYAQNGVRKNLKSRLIDPSYQIQSNHSFKNKMHELLDEGFEIGLHGSYYSAIQSQVMEIEKQILESVINTPVKKVRQHWLHYSENITPYIHQQFFEFDSTLGWNDRFGFRSGSASRYRPYDHINQRPFSFFETPQFLMDSNIFDYSTHSLQVSLNKIQSIFNTLKELKNVCFSVSWHTHSCNNDFPWHHTYQDIVRMVQQYDK